MVYYMFSTMANKIVDELGVKVNLASDHHSPERTTTFYNPKMCKNRMLVLCALTAAIREKAAKGGDKRMKCLDAFGATGIMGLQWKAHHGGDVSVTISDTKPASVTNIERNCALNNVLVQNGKMKEAEVEEQKTRGRAEQGKETKTEWTCVKTSTDGDSAKVDRSEDGREVDSESELDGGKMNVGDGEVLDVSEHSSRLTDVEREHKEDKKSMNLKEGTSVLNRGSIFSNKGETVAVLCSDAHLVMRQRYFDFIHLDPYGCAVPFMDSAFCNVGNRGIVSVTSTDTAALYGQCPQVTLRNYGGRVARCEYLRELAARLIVASATRAAARCNKGVEVLLCVALEHFVLVILRVKRGAGPADRSVERVKNVLHCQVCGQRTFVPNTLSVPSSLYPLLECECHTTAPGMTAVLLGPVWSGNIYDAEFVGGMELAGRELGLGKKDVQLLGSLRAEAVCSGDLRPQDACVNLE